MKRLTCEMCGSTDLVKQDGTFICQTCGTKYTTEEAKKLLVEVEGAVEVKNAAQVDNLLQLAHSSFDSKNYAQAEAFCNQVIAMDATNYEAWKLKGEAINYQITTRNQRILEVYNCIMTSYRVLDERGKETHREEILKSLRVCLEGEIDFRLNQLESQRPTESVILQAENAFLDCTSKILTSFQELGYSDEEAKKYSTDLKAYFVKQANIVCVKVWGSTYHNYYRDGFTDDYHPTDEIWQTYLHEGDNLIELLGFCIDNFADEVSVTQRALIYQNIIFMLGELAESKSYKRMVSTTRNGYGAVLDRHEYWDVDRYLTDSAVDARKQMIAELQERIKQEFIADSSGRTVDELVQLGIEHLENEHGDFAVFRFEEVVKQKPKSPVGYLGLAVSVASEITAIGYVETASHCATAEDEKDNVHRLINFQYGEGKITLLMIAACHYEYNAVKYLIDSGADVNIRSSHSATALWFVCHDRIKKKDQINGRRVAQFLLDHGAGIDVKNNNGVGLYNLKTDKEIKRMIQRKFPNAELGAAPVNAFGCYVATCIYGSYDCPQVWTLRRYRDNTLAKTWYGRAFIRTYYAISPTLVKWFGNTRWFKKMWRGKLDRMVSKLQADGVASTPYQDRTWQ